MTRARKPEKTQPTKHRSRPVAAKTANFTPDAVSVLDHKVKIWMKVTVSLVVLGLTLFVVISNNHSPTEKHWAYGMLGTILGWWLKI